jgi:hypothetical protein
LGVCCIPSMVLSEFYLQGTFISFEQLFSFPLLSGV